MADTIKERVGKLREAADAKGLALGRHTEFVESIEFLTILSPDQEAKLARLERSAEDAT